MSPDKETTVSPVNFELLFEASPDLYIILAPDLSIVTASKAFLVTTDTTLAGIKGRDIFEVFPDNPEDPAAKGSLNLRSSLERVLKNRVSDAVAIQRYDIPLSDGTFEERYWSTTNHPVFDASGELVYIVLRPEDITGYASLILANTSGDVYLNPQFIRNSLQALYAVTVAGSMDAIVSFNTAEEITLFNAAAERIFGYSAQQMLGKNVGILTPDRCRAERSELIQKFAESDADHILMGNPGQLVGLRANGEEFPIEASISQMGKGPQKLYTVMIRDISEKRKIESQFLRAQRMESIGTLAGGIAHDLNNILAPIMLSIGTLKMMITDPLAREMLDSIDISARNGADIVQQVLSFARGIEGNIVEVQPKHLLNDVETMLRNTLPKHIRLKISVAVDTWAIMGDPTQLHQVLLNLSVNARDAMPGGGTLTITTENCKIDKHYVAMNSLATVGPHVLISVTDTGTGIPLEIIDKIFEPFFTTKGPGKGTGLGLSTVIAITKSHGGFVNVYSEPNKGTTFKIYLPAAPDYVSENRTSQQQEEEVPRGYGETILVVDDEPSIRLITSKALESFGYRALTAANGAEGVAIYAQRQKEISVVLTDMMMPVMDGPATIYALLQINPEVQIIAASGLDANGNVAKAASAGIKHFIKKPYTAQALLKLLREILGATL
jgi:PAS domain S-box-containing protein